MTSAEDIRTLSKPRRLVTRELSPFNAFYGHAHVLRTYAGIEGSEPLKAAIEHGPTLYPTPADPDLATWLPRYFCAAPAQASFHDEHTRHGARAVAIGSPILYARALAPPVPDSTRRLVYFDAHSSHYLTSRYDLDSAAAGLASLRDRFDEIVVCLYWRDILRGRADSYLRRGFRCVTAGHMFDPCFLFRLVKIIASSTVVLTDWIGTHLLYALALERPVWLDYRPADYELDLNAPHGHLVHRIGALTERAPALFGCRVDEIQPDQRAFSDELNGTRCFRSPTELAALLAEAEAAYRSETPLRRRFQLEATATARRLWNARPW